MRPGCCCTTRLRHTEGQGLHSQPSNLPSPTSIYTCISSSSTIRYYPEICRRYSAPTNPSVTIICFRYRSARARHGSAGIYRTLEDKILQVQSSAWAWRWAESAGLMEPDLRQWPHAPSRGWSTLHTLLQVGVVLQWDTLQSSTCLTAFHVCGNNVVNVIRLDYIHIGLKSPFTRSYLWQMSKV